MPIREIELIDPLARILEAARHFTEDDTADALRYMSHPRPPGKPYYGKSIPKMLEEHQRELNQRTARALMADDEYWAVQPMEIGHIDRFRIIVSEPLSVPVASSRGARVRPG